MAFLLGLAPPRSAKIGTVPPDAPTAAPLRHLAGNTDAVRAIFSFLSAGVRAPDPEEMHRRAVSAAEERAAAVAAQAARAAAETETGSAAGSAEGTRKSGESFLERRRALQQKKRVAELGVSNKASSAPRPAQLRAHLVTPQPLIEGDALSVVHPQLQAIIPVRSVQPLRRSLTWRRGRRRASPTTWSRARFGSTSTRSRFRQRGPTRAQRRCP